MVFSKSFGYALRGTLYVALMSDDRKRIQVDEIAKKLSVPKFFLGKIMNKIVKEGILNSTKGPYGGFSINSGTLQTSLMTLIGVTDGTEQFSSCLLHFRQCNPQTPCPLHIEMEQNRRHFRTVLINTTIADLLKQNRGELILSIQ
jgi:Rrf2 family iron-sulfur cluster assembly transcriptional regulator